VCPRGIEKALQQASLEAAAEQPIPKLTQDGTVNLTKFRPFSGVSAIPRRV